MGIVEKLKNLNKQTLLKLSSIGRVAVADAASVDNSKYLSLSRPLSDYLSDGVNKELAVEAKGRARRQAKKSLQL